MLLAFHLVESRLVDIETLDGLSSWARKRPGESGVYSIGPNRIMV